MLIIFLVLVSWLKTGENKIEIEGNKRKNAKKAHTYKKKKKSI